MTIDLPLDQTFEHDAASELAPRVELPSGGELQRPNPEVIAWLQSQDNRVNYFPADLGRLTTGMSELQEYSLGIADPIGQRIYDDFAGEQVAVRGSTVALQESYPYKTNGSISMNTVLEILASGSDTGADTTRVGYIAPPKEGAPARLNAQTSEHLEEHMGSVAFRLGLGGKEEDLRNLDQTFPAVIVYDETSFSDKPSHGWRTLHGDPSGRIKAIYITDRVISSALRQNLPKSVPRANTVQLGRAAVGGDSAFMTELHL